VVVTAVAPNSPADETGLQPGDVIAPANRKPARNLSDYRKAVAGAADASQPLLLVQRQGQSAFVALHRAP
jgi:serine protease Do